MNKFPTIDYGSEAGSWLKAIGDNPGGALKVLGDDLDGEFTETDTPTPAVPPLQPAGQTGGGLPTADAPACFGSSPFHEAHNAD